MHTSRPDHDNPASALLLTSMAYSSPSVSDLTFTSRLSLMLRLPRAFTSSRLPPIPCFTAPSPATCTMVLPLPLSEPARPTTISSQPT